MSDDREMREALAAYFAAADAAHENGAVDALERAIETYAGFIAEVARDIARENEHEHVTREDVLDACE